MINSTLIRFFFVICILVLSSFSINWIAKDRNDYGKITCGFVKTIERLPTITGWEYRLVLGIRDGKPKVFQITETIYYSLQKNENICVYQEPIFGAIYKIEVK